MKKIILCSWCIRGIQSHGEPVYVGSEIDDTDTKCEFCEEDDPDEEYFECVFD